MKILKQVLKLITNGVLLIIIGLLHTKLVISSEGCGRQFKEFSESWFYKISSGGDELPAIVGKTNFETFAAFWFFYFGIFLIPLGILVDSIERKYKILPNSFTISYIIFVIIGSYMIPSSGMTIIMLPHAVYMLVSNYIKAKRLRIDYGRS